MKLRAVKKNDDARARIRELFRQADETKAARVAGEERIEQLERKRADLEASVPGLEKAVKDAEYDWRLSQARQEVGEAAAEDVATAEKAIDGATARLAEAKGKAEAMESLLAEAQNKLPSLKLAEGTALRRPWEAISEGMEPAVQEAAEVLRRFYVAELYRFHFGISADIFYRRIVPLGDAVTIAAELEQEYRG
jgi:chromosome segregation ATPase